MIARFLMLAALAGWIAAGLSAPAMAQASSAPAAAPAAAPAKAMPMKGKAMKKSAARKPKAGGGKLDNIADQLNGCELKAQGERAACITQATTM